MRDEGNGNTSSDTDRPNRPFLSCAAFIIDVVVVDILALFDDVDVVDDDDADVVVVGGGGGNAGNVVERTNFCGKSDFRFAPFFRLISIDDKDDF